MLNRKFEEVFRSGNTTVILAIFSLLSVIYGFWFLKFGFDINDEAYQTMNAMNPMINPQAILSSYISSLWGGLFGFSLYSMRILTFSLNLLSIGFAVCFLYEKMHKRNLSLLLFGMLMCISLCVPVKSRLIGWDCYAIFFTTLSLIMMVKIWSKTNVRRLIILGILSGCAILSRFPDVVIVPVAIICIFSSDCKKKFLASVIYIVSILLSMTVLLCLIYHGAIFQWITDLKSSFVSGHSIGRLMNNYLHTGMFELIDIIIVSILLAVKNKLVKTDNKRILYDIIVLAIFILILSFKINRVYYPVNRLLNSGIILSLVLYIINAKKGDRAKCFFRSLVILGCCVVPMAGSDGGTSKFMNLSVVPIIFSLFPSSDENERYDSGRSFSSIFWIILLSCTIIMPFYTAKHTTFDGGWTNARYAVNHVLLKNDTTTEERATEINDMLEEGAAALPDKFLVIGHNNRRFFSEYLFGQRNELWPHSWSDKILEDNEKIDLLLDKIKSGEVHDIVFVKYGANEFADFEDNPMRKAIESTGNYEIKDYKWFVVCEDEHVR